MASDEEVLAATVRDYFLKNGGRVKGDDLFDHFRGQLNKFDELGTTKNRFGDIVDSLASLQTIEGEKYFVLKKARNGTTPVVLRRQIRQGNNRKDKGLSLPASMRNFRFSAAEDTFGNFAVGDVSKGRPSTGGRPRAGFKSESYDSGMKRNSSDTSLGDKNNQGNDSGVDIAVSPVSTESPKGSRLSSFSKNSEGDQISQNSGDTGVNEDENYYEHDVPLHILTSLQKSWMMSTMMGKKSEIICQLEEDPSIVKFKDFIMGYTGLHWAARQGSEDLVRLLVDRGADVNIKSNGGYTPLHLATMYGKVNVINLLIDDYHANVHIRDHSGKEPKDVVTKNLSEEIKQKLSDPDAGLDSNSTSGFSRYMEKDTPRIKPKLKAGASFRFLKKQKRVRRPERPVIEHWDSSRQERLESTLESDEKELYKMQRSNSGSLFPALFYSAKKKSQSEQVEEKADSVDGGGELEDSRQRSLSRSCPENEFRNFARISEDESQASGHEHSSPTVSLSTRSAVEGGRRMLGDKVDHSPVSVGSVLVSDPIKRRSYSDNNLSKHAFQDELAERFTMDKASNNRPPSTFSDDISSSKQTEKLENKNGELLRLKIDSSPAKRPLDPFKGKELQTFMTVPNHKIEVASPHDTNPPLKLSTQQSGQLSSTSQQNGKLGGNSLQNGRPLQEVNSLQMDKPLSEDGNLSSFGEEKPTPDAYNSKEVISKLNNNYKQVSEILTSNEQTNAEVTQEEPTSPVRPPRKKDKKLKKSRNVEENEQNIFDFETGPASMYPEESVDGTMPTYLTDKDKGYARALQNDYRMQNRASADYKKQNLKGPENWQDGVDQDYSGGSKNQDNTRRRSDGFAIPRAYSDDNMLSQKENLNSRRKSEGIASSAREKAGYDEFRRSGVDSTRPKSEGFAKLNPERFSSQKEVSLDHPRRRSLEKAMKFGSESTRRQSEGFADQRRSEGFPGQLRLDGPSNQKEVSLDRPRRSSLEEAMKSSSETTRRDSQDSVDQQKSGGFADQRKSWGHTGSRSLDAYSSEKDLSLDHSRRRTMDSLPSQTSQTRHVLPKVLLDTSRRQASSGYTEKLQDTPSPSGDDQRVLPPYRPPLRPNYMPPPPPVGKQPPPYQTRQDLTHSYSGNNSDSDPPIGYPYPTTRPNELSYHSSENLSKNILPGYSSPSDAIPTAPPRKHRKSSSSEDTVYPSPTAEISPTAPPRKHRGSVPYSYHRPDDISPTTPPDKYPSYYRPEDYPPTDLSPTPPSRKHRGTVRSSSEGLPTTTSRPSYPPPSLPSNVSAARPPTNQRDEDSTFGPQVSLDHPKRHYEPDSIAAIPARSYDRTEYNTQSSNYDRSERKDYFPSPDFEGKSSYYRPPQPNEYDQTGYVNYHPQSSTSRQSEGNEYNQADSSYSQTNSLMYPYGSSYASEFKSNFEPTAARDQVDGHESRSIRPRSAVDTTTHDQSPPEEVVIAMSVALEPNRVMDYPEELPSNRQEPLNMSGNDINRRNGTYAQPSYENDFVIKPKYEGYSEANPVLTPKYEGYTEANPVLMPKYEGYTETNPVVTPKYEGYTEANPVVTPKYEGYTETNPVVTPKYERYTETNMSRPEFHAENNIVEPEFIVAKQMSAQNLVTEGRPVGSREDINTLPGALGMEMKNKWVSNSSDGSNESTENKKYRMTSII